MYPIRQISGYLPGDIFSYCLILIVYGELAHDIRGILQLLDISDVRVRVVVRLVVVAKIIPSSTAPLAAAALGLDFRSVTHCVYFLK